MNLLHNQPINRRDFLNKTTLGLGGAALASLMQPTALFGKSSSSLSDTIGSPHFAPKAKRVIYLFQSGGPSQMELFDYKPTLEKMHGEELPASIRQGQRLTGMTSGQTSFPLAGSHFSFAQHGQSGAWVSELMPHTAKVVDELCFVRSMYTEAINHDPAITFFQTGSQQPGRPCIGSWLSYGLGSANENLPAFCVLLSEGRSRAQPLYSRLWSNGFLASEHQGVQFRSGENPVLYLNNPPSIDKADRGRQLAVLKQMHELQYERLEDPEINSKIAQYEMAYRMQTSVPETMDIASEPDATYELYGEEARIPGTYAANCLLARRLAERDVKFIQLYHQGWDQHGNLPKDISAMAKSVRPSFGGPGDGLEATRLVRRYPGDLGGEFGRTNYSQGRLTKDNYGRDHHPRCFTMWMAGAGVKKGLVYGETDDFSYNIVKNPVHVHDFQATLLHLLGVDHERLTFKHQGRRYRLTDVHGHVVHDILA